ncbi:MAG: histidine phosphatase family protein [Dehalococcoidia bacterium]|nr:histidine phosphatase family protein [Dehalococcoidia bacterium]
MKLILVRHGETAWNEDRLVQGGDIDVELNETGLAQAQKVAVFLSDEPVTLVLSSPLQRARATAEAIAAHHGLPVQTDHRLRELRLGALDGMSISSLNTTFSQFLSGWWQEKGPTTSPDGETFVQLQERTWPVVQDLLAAPRPVAGNPGRAAQTTAVLVSHFFVTLAIILRALGLPADSFPRFRVDLAGVSVLEFADHGARLVTFNDTSY